MYNRGNAMRSIAVLLLLGTLAAADGKGGKIAWSRDGAAALRRMREQERAGFLYFTADW